jgi:hypothetical protein
MGPKTFLAALFRGGKRFPVTGYAHHPYAMPLVAKPIGTNPDGTTAPSIWGQLRFRANKRSSPAYSYSSGRSARRIGPTPARRSG